MGNLIEKHPYLTITALWFCVYTLHLDVLYINIMEARNFITAREMLVDGNWLLTTMDGLPRYEKPPLPTWLVAISGSIFGLDNIAALRFPSAVVTLLLMCQFFIFSRKLTQNKIYSLIATLILGTSYFIIFAGRNGTWDIFAHTFMLCGILYLFQFFETQRSSYAYALLAGLFIGLSFMSKGPVSHYALMLPFLIAYGFIYKFKNFKNKWFPLIIMLFIIGALSSWWLFYIYINDVTGTTRIAEKESSRWIGYQIKPFYYYWSFFMQSGIWVIPAFISLLFPYLKSRVTDLKAYKFSLIWILLSIVLLSLIPTKKTRYLLPVLIPLALTIAFYIEYLFSAFKAKISKWENITISLYHGFIGSMGVIFPISAYIYFGEKLDGHYFYYIVSSIIFFIIGSFICYQLIKRNYPSLFYSTIIFVMFIIAFGFPLVNAILDNPSYNSISKLVDSPIPVYTIQGQAPELVWEYGKPITPKTKDELLTTNAETSFGILTYHGETIDLLSFENKKYRIEYQETFDLNPIDSSKSGYKKRLKADYYIIKKIE